MPQIVISDLEVFYHVGVPDEERASPQRLLITVRMEHDFIPAALSDDLRKTIDYNSVAQHLLRFGKDRNWHLIEKLASDIANYLSTEFGPESVFVEVKKFIIPQAAYVSVSLTKGRTGS